jgi:hypothetical protein
MSVDIVKKDFRTEPPYTLSFLAVHFSERYRVDFTIKFLLEIIECSSGFFANASDIIQSTT